MKRRNPDKRSRFWLLALALSLLVHAGILAGVSGLDLTGPAPLQAEDQPVMEFVFAPEDFPQEDPQYFTELPPDRKDEAPERADFLSNVQSRARDMVPGEEESALPASDGRSEAPNVRMEPGEAGFGQSPTETKQEEDSAALEEIPPELATEPAVPEATKAKEEPAPQEDREVAALAGAAVLAEALDPPVAPEPSAPDAVDWPAADIQKEAQPEVKASPLASLRSSGLYQESFANPQGNALLQGEHSLNTSAWVYGYWMTRFRRAVSEHWVPPYAYRFGMLDGWTLVELEVDRLGKLLRCDVLDEEGHMSLRVASVDAIKAAAPFEPLPDNLPEETLVLQIKMIYSAFGN